ncbi:MAG: bifunctional oligoribonuclease/PAP phosphatase NrnA [Chloroflexi bacterium]|nr:MAG: bifunctional oligoribonuclease/PAP phosphatase NrnA [Chloroflexota bacterium]
MAWITRKGSSAASWVCVCRTCASRPTCIFSSTRAWPTACGSASFYVKFRKGNQTPAAELAPPRPEVAELAPRIWQVIDDAPVVTAVTHKDADGDTLGSALALALALEPIGKSVPVLSSPPVPGAWWFLPGIERVNRQAPPRGTPVFIFDASDASRAGAYEPVVTQARVVVNVDHHVSNTRFATLNLVLTDAASTGELVYDLLKAWKIDIPPGAASNLYATILSDTGGFRHENTSGHALRAAAELVQLGADPVMIARGLFKSRPASSLRMQGRILQGLHYEFGDRLVWGSISQSGLRDSGATTDQADSAIDQLNTLRDQELAILFKEAGPRVTKVSIRSRDRIDAAELAARFGGGGHKRAAGMELALPLKEAEARVLAEVRGRMNDLE